MSKVPFMVIIGEQEAAQQTVSVRQHGGNDLGAMPLEDFADLIKRQTAEEQEIFTTK
jgi:threonyl-tRNA synthetase